MSNELLTVIGFDPGESTGFVVLGIKAGDLMASHNELHNRVVTLACGTINCHDAEGQGLAVRKHAGLNMFGENTGITQMLDVATTFPLAAIVIEDFIPDFKKMDQARHTLSPVRLMAGFSYGLSCLPTDDGRLGEERMFVQNRSLAKTTCTDERLINWGLNLKGESRHARDAMKHAFYFLKSAHNLRNQIESSAEIRHLAWPHVFDDPVITKKKKPRKPRPLGDRI